MIELLPKQSPLLLFSTGSGLGDGQEHDDLTDTSAEAAGGVGIRYLGVRALGLSMGQDFAKGPEEDSVYLSFGTRF